MQRKIQVIGLPGAGKTTAIKQFLSRNKKEITYLDLSKYASSTKERDFKAAINNTSNNVIAESACGVLSTDTWVVKLEPDIQDIYVNCISRDSYVDADYLSLLAGQMITPHCTIKSTEELTSVLNNIFNQ